MARIPRKKILKKFRDMIDARVPIVGGGAGTGLSAKCEEAGGIDLIVIYNSGRYRMAGRGSLAGMMAYGNANEIVVEMAAEVLPVVATFASLAHYLFALPVLLVALAVARFALHYPVGGWSALLLPFALLVQLPFVAGLALGLAAAGQR